jgi:hypothetical protein
MTVHRRRRATAALAVTLTLPLTLTLTSCNDDETPSSVASRAESAFESATAEAGRRLDEIKGGVDAKDEVTLGDPTTNAGDRTTVGITASNTTDSTKSFAVQVNFTDQDGNWLDTVVVTVPDVAAGESAKATARSTRALSGEVEAEVERAVRY